MVQRHKTGPGSKGGKQSQAAEAGNRARQQSQETVPGSIGRKKRQAAKAGSRALITGSRGRKQSKAAEYLEGIM